jgi:hypothetical protein
VYVNFAFLLRCCWILMSNGAGRKATHGIKAMNRMTALAASHGITSEASVIKNDLEEMKKESDREHVTVSIFLSCPIFLIPVLTYLHINRRLSLRTLKRVRRTTSRPSQRKKSASRWLKPISTVEKRRRPSRRAARARSSRRRRRTHLDGSSCRKS